MFMANASCRNCIVSELTENFDMYNFILWRNLGWVIFTRLQTEIYIFEDYRGLAVCVSTHELSCFYL